VCVCVCGEELDDEVTAKKESRHRRRQSAEIT